MCLVVSDSVLLVFACFSKKFEGQIWIFIVDLGVFDSFSEIYSYEYVSIECGAVFVLVERFVSPFVEVDL